MSAFVGIKRCAAWFPSRTPYRVAILDIEISTVVVHWHIVVSISGDSAEFCILIETISTSRVRYQRKEILVAKIINPRPRCLGIGDDILTVGVIKVSILFFHNVILYVWLN